MTKQWLITGASSGLGRALAETVASNGDHVIAAARDVGALEDLVARHGAAITPWKLDVTDRDAIADLAERAGPIDVLVNNAGYGFIAAVEEADERDIRDQFEVNFFGAVALTRALLPAMRQRRSGWIVNVSSAAGVVSGAGAAFYSGSKFALEAFSDALAAELSPLGIGVTIVEPGALRTDFAGRSLRSSDKVAGHYETVERTRSYLSHSNGMQMGDPVKAAILIAQAAGNADAPLRLLLGPDCQQLVERRLSERLAEAQAQKETAASILFAEGQADLATPFD
ncbi:Short-chain dehydrogenase [Sphingobium faniae]|nr:Short-chain dehydrogenase [Sphingobium faniae]